MHFALRILAAFPNDPVLAKQYVFFKQRAVFFEFVLHVMASTVDEAVGKGSSIPRVLISSMSTHQNKTVDLNNGLYFLFSTELRPPWEGRKVWSRRTTHGVPS